MEPGVVERVATWPYEVVEFDGHKIDLRLTLRIDDPFGFETLLVLHRIWILVLFDVASRAVIGYALALGREYNKDEMAVALQSALTPHRTRDSKIPALRVRAGGGFPSEVTPGTAWACWNTLRFDAARAHFAKATLERLTTVVGCATHNGPMGQKNERALIERFFDQLASHFAHRLPGTTGSDPRALERPHLQVLDTHHRVVIADRGRGLVQVVAASVADAGTDALDAGLVPVAAELRLAAHRPLRATQARFIPPEAVQRFEKRAVAERCKTGDADIDANRTGHWLLDLARRLVETNHFPPDSLTVTLRTSPSTSRLLR